MSTEALTERPTTQLVITFDYSIAEDLEVYRSTADELRQQDAEVTVQQPPPGHNVLPFVPIVLLALVAAGGVLQFIEWWRRVHQYEQIITYKDGAVHVQIVPIKNGKVLVFADKDTVVDVEDVGPLLDLTEIAKAVLTAGAEAASAAAKAAGALVEVVKPTDDATLAALVEMAA